MELPSLSLRTVSLRTSAHRASSLRHSRRALVGAALPWDERQACAPNTVGFSYLVMGNFQMMISLCRKLVGIPFSLSLGATCCSADDFQRHPSPPDPDFTEAPIVLETETGDIFGTLTLPLGEPPFDDVVLFVSGSGPTDRDGNSSALPGRNDSLLQLAQSLAMRDIASVRFDKRGIGQSAAAAPDESELRFDTYVQDASVWLEQLRTDDRFRSVAILGHSEGSLVAMLAASSANADAFVSVAGTSRPASHLLEEQLAQQLPPALQADSDRILSSLERGEVTDDVPSELAAVYRPSVQPYLISWLKYDPSAEIRKLDSPILIVQGTTDTQVPISDAHALHEAAAGSELVLVEGMNHVLKQVPDDTDEQLASYSDPSLPIDEQLVGAVAAFLR